MTQVAPGRKMTQVASGRKMTHVVGVFLASFMDVGRLGCQELGRRCTQTPNDMKKASQGLEMGSLLECFWKLEASFFICFWFAFYSMFCSLG